MKEFITSKTSVFNGEIREVTVYGKCYTTKEPYVKESKVKNEGRFYSHTITEGFRKTWHLEIVFTIQNPNDAQNPKEALAICRRRIKRKQFHLNISSTNYLAPDICQTIVNHECDYIAKNVDSFINKLKARS